MNIILQNNDTKRKKKTSLNWDGRNYQLQDWLKRFVEKLGEGRSARLNQTAGFIDNGKIRLMDISLHLPTYSGYLRPPCFMTQ
jgi:hypothetical protein